MTSSRISERAGRGAGLLRRKICHVFHPGAHRSSYRDLMMDAFDMDGMVGAPRRRKLVELLLARQVLFATIDGSYRDFLIVGWLRSVAGLPTVGLFVASTAMLRKASESPRTRALVFAMRLSARLSKMKILTIIPHDICPELRAFGCDWIHDPQMWDLTANESADSLPTSSLSERVERERSGRSVVIYVGKASTEKGFPELVRFARSHRDDVLVVAGGLVQDECADDAAGLRELGMIVEDRYLTDDEVISLYGVGDFAWCYYPHRDQASGVFGRAVQTGAVPLVRRGSFLAAYADWYDLPCLVTEVSDDGDQIDASDLRRRRGALPPARRQTLEGMRDLSLRKIREALEA